MQGADQSEGGEMLASDEIPVLDTIVMRTLCNLEHLYTEENNEAGRRNLKSILL